MSMLMIKCPNTGKPVATGIDWPKEQRTSLKELNGKIDPCPHCKQAHAWSGADVLP